MAQATARGSAERGKGISILLVETADLPGYRVGRILDKMSLKSQDTAELFFENVSIPATYLLGGVEGRGLAQMMSDLPYERVLVALTAVGAMEGALAATTRYAKERAALGRTLAEFQNTRFELAEAATITRIARIFIDDCVARSPPARLIPRRPPWRSGGRPTCSRRCSMYASSCTAAMGT